MPTLKLRLSIPNIPFLFNPDLIGGGLLSVDTTFITIDSDIFRADNHYNLTRSAEMLTNGIFLTDSSWAKTNATISGGKANFNISSGAYAKLEQSVTYVEGRTYRLFAVVNGTAGKKIRFRDNTGNNGGLTSSNGQITMDGTDQFIEFIFTATSSSDVIAIERQDNESDDNYSFTVDNVSITEDQTFGPELVLNGDYEQEGINLVTNGEFDTDTNWTKGSGWSISEGEAICNATGGFSSFRQTGILTSGKIYKITFDFDGSGVTSGSFKLNGGDFGNASSGERTIVDGTNIFYLEATSNSFGINQGGAVGTGIFDNVSVVEVGQDFTFGTGWGMSDDKAVGVNATGNLQQSISFTNGKIYKVSFEVSDYVSGQVRLQTNQQNSVTVSANGTYTEYLTMTTDSLLILNGIDSNPFNGSITNISVKEDRSLNIL